MKTLIANGLIEVDHHLLIMALIGIQEIGLIEDEYNRHRISLRRSKEAVDERRGGLGVSHGDDKESLIEIAGDDAALLREVRGTADDIVLTVIDSRDESLSFLVDDDLHAVTYGHGVRGADAFEPELAFHLALHRLPLIGQHRVPESRVLNYQAVH